MYRINNIERSLFAIADLLSLQMGSGFTVSHIYYTTEYEFLNVADYLTEVEEYLVKYDGNYIRDKIAKHLAVADYINENFESLSGIAGVDILCTLTNDTTAFLNDAILWYQDNDERCFADIDIAYHTVCPTERGERTIVVTGWTENRGKNIELEQRAGKTETVEFCQIIDQVQRIIDGLSKLPLSEDTTQSAPLITKKDLPCHFSLDWTGDGDEEYAQSVYTRLVVYEILHTDTTYEDFYYVCTGLRGSDNFTPLRWLLRVNDLAYFVDSLFGEHRGCTSIASRCFVLRDGTAPNIGTMDRKINKIRNKGEGYPRNKGMIDLSISR